MNYTIKEDKIIIDNTNDADILVAVLAEKKKIHKIEQAQALLFGYPSDRSSNYNDDDFKDVYKALFRCKQKKLDKIKSFGIEKSEWSQIYKLEKDINDIKLKIDIDKKTLKLKI